MKRKLQLFVLSICLSNSYLNAQNGKSESIINSGNDDAKEFNDGKISIPDTYLILGGGTDFKNNGFIFRNNEIPATAEIKDAYIEFYAYANSAPANINIYAEKTNTTSYTEDFQNITKREYTTNKINWQTEAWHLDGVKYRTPNLRNIIDEIRLKGWKSGENIAFKFEGLKLNYGATVRAYEGTAAYRPRLVIEYVNNGTGPSIVNDPEEIRMTAAIVESQSGNGREYNDGFMIVGPNSLPLAGDVNSNKTGIRFQGIEFPNDAEITEAYIQFYSEGSGNAAITSIKSEIGNAKAFSFDKNLSSRTYSENTEVWNMPQQTDLAQITTVNIKKLIDENRLKGWQSGQSMSFLFEGDAITGKNGLVHSYDLSTMYTPRLVIKYKNNKKGPDSTIISTLKDVITDPSQMKGLVINEVAAQGTIDEKEDWIELYNGLDKSIFINGNVAISNKDTKLDLCVLKNILIPAKGFYTLIADKKPENGSQHLNFDLKNTGGNIYLSTLVNKKTTALDELKYTETPYNTSFGRNTDGAAALTSFITSTYNASNNSGQQNLALNFSKERGVYPTGFDLTITAPAGTTIKYTLDGKFPSETVGEQYTAPISIEQTCVLKVYAYDTKGNSGVLSHTYVLQNNYDNEVRNPEQRLEWLSKDYLINAEEYAKAIAEVPIISIAADTDVETDWLQSSFEYLDKHIYADHSNFFSNSTSKKYGQASSLQHNAGFKFKFNSDAQVKKANYPFFEPYPGDVFPTSNKIQTLEVKEGQDGPQSKNFNLGYLRFDEKVTMNLCKEMGKYALDTRFVHLFINGKYRGLKTMRNDFKANNLEEVFGDKADNYTTVNLQDENFTTGIVEEGEGSSAIWQNIKNLAAAKDFQGFKKWVDIEDFIKFQIMYMFIDTEEEATAIIHNNAPEFMKAKMNINDTDGGFFGGFTSPTSDIEMPVTRFAGGGGNYKYKWQESSSRLGPGGLFGKFMGSNENETTGNLEFKTLVKDYVKAAFGDSESTVAAPLSVSNVQNKIQNAVTELDNLYKLDAAYMSYYRGVYDYWKNTDCPRVIAQVPERVSYSLEKWNEYNMAHSLLPAPFNLDTSDQVKITNPNTAAKVYYTIDGSDPMGKDGVVSSSAFEYITDKNIELPNGKHTLVSRAFAPNNWGPLSKADVDGATLSVPDINDELLNTEAQNVIIYPNPAKNEINIDLKNSDSVNSKMSIYAIDGKLVHNNILKSQSNKVNISDLSSGYYIVKIINENGKTSTHKLIKK